MLWIILVITTVSGLCLWSFWLKRCQSLTLAFPPLALETRGFLSSTMAAVSSVVLSAAEAEEAMAKLEPGLSFVLESAGVPAEVQAVIGHLGYRTLALFSRAASKEEDMRAFVVEDLKVDPSSGTGARLATAAVLVAWDAGRRRLEKRLDEEATQRATDGLPRPLLKGAFLEVKRAYEQFRKAKDPFFMLEDKGMPSKAYLEALLERVEDGDLKPESLADVLTADKDSDDPWGVVRTGTDGLMRLQKTRVTGTPPSGPEDLRRRYRVMAAAWQCVSFKLANTPFLKGYTEACFDKLLEHLLGDQVFEYRCETAEGLTHNCSWAQLLHYEYEVRRRAFKRMEEGSAFPDALGEAIRCERTRRQHFETPMTMAAGAAMASRGRSSATAPLGRSRTPGGHTSAGSSPKGTAKGRGKSKGRGRSSGPPPPTKPRCFRFQRNKCKIQDCVFEHSCSKCGATDHGSGWPNAPCKKAN